MKSGTRAISTAKDSISSIPGLHLWLDGTDATTMTISGGLISQWRDKSAVGNHLSQATGSLQPTMGTLSGKPAVFFDGTGRYLLSSPVAAMSGDNPFSAFIVWNKTHAVNTACRPFGWGGADQGGFVSLFGSASGSSLSSWSFGGTASYQLGLQPNAEDYHLTHTTYLDCIVKRSGLLRSTTECYRSGEYKVMTAAQALVSLTLNVLGWGWGYAAGIGYAQLPAAATSLNGHIGEILVFNTAVSSANRKVIENYLSKKWAVNLQNYRTGTAPANAPVSSPLDIPDCSLWLDSADSSTLYTSGAGSVTAVSSPLDVTGCRLWLDGSDSSASSMTLTGSLIDVWKDKSGNGRDFSASSSARPTLNPATFYVTTSSVAFNGSSTTMVGNAAAGAVLRNLSAYTVFSVVRTSSVAAGERFAFGFGTAGSVIFRTGMQDSRPFSGGRRVEADTLESVTGSSGSLSTGTTFIQTAVVNHSSLSLTGLRNGLVYGADATYMGSGSTADVACIVSVGTQSGGTYGFWNGDIAEVIVFGGVVSDADRARVEKYLSSKWVVSGVHVALGSQFFPAGLPVGLWSDKSTAAQHVKTTGTGPTYTENLQGGKPGLFFNAVGSSLISTASRSTPVPCTILAVVKNLATASSIGGVACYGSVVSGGGNGGQGIYANGTTEYITDGSGVVASNSSDTSSLISALPKIITAQYTGANTTAGSKMFNNNVLEELYAGVGGPTLTSVCVEVGGRTGGSQPTRLFRGNIHEVITYDRAITEPERCSVERYLSEKWGIAISPPTCGHPDAQDWINRVYENRGSVSQNTANIVNNLCYLIDAAGIRDRFMRLNLFCGNNLAACLVPLYRGASLSSAQYGGRIDTNVSFVEADYVESGPTTGLKGNAATKRLDTGVLQSDFPVGSRHMAAYETERDPNPYRNIIGSRRNTALGVDYRNFFYLATFGVATTYTFQTGFQLNSGAGDSTGYTSAGAFWVGNQPTSTTKRLYKNGAAATGADTTIIAPTRESFSQYVFALNDTNVATSWSNVRLGAYSLGLAMSAAQIASYNTIMQAFQTSLGRNV